MGGGGAYLERLAALVAAGRLDCRISRTASWREAPQQVQDLLDRRFPGKAVLAVD
jgi:hypothetical protein